MSRYKCRMRSSQTVPPTRSRHAKTCRRMRVSDRTANGAAPNACRCRSLGAALLARCQTAFLQRGSCTLGTPGGAGSPAATCRRPSWYHWCKRRARQKARPNPALHRCPIARRMADQFRAPACTWLSGICRCHLARRSYRRLPFRQHRCHIGSRHQPGAERSARCRVSLPIWACEWGRALRDVACCSRGYARDIGFCPRLKISTTRMRSLLQGHGSRKESGKISAGSGAATGVGWAPSTPSRSRISWMFVLRVELVRKP